MNRQTYLLMISFISSLIGIILMVIGYSKISITINLYDIFDPTIDRYYSLEKIKENVVKNFNNSEGHTYIIAGGLCTALSGAISFYILVSIILKNNNKNKIISIPQAPESEFMTHNPMHRDIP
jgi:hypothetical protein